MSAKKRKGRGLVDPGMPKAAAAMDGIERETGMPFEEWVRRAAEWPLGILVEPQPGNAVEMKLVNFPGLVIGRWSFDGEVFEHLTKASARSGQALLDFVVSAIHEKCERMKGGAR